MITALERIGWERARTRLHDTMPEYSYKTWIESLELLDVDERHTFKFRGPSLFARNLAKRYLPQIVAAIQAEMGEDWNVEVTSSEEGFLPVAPAAPTYPKPTLNSRYTFDTFVVGSNNRFAHAAALAVADMPAGAYNPLFLYGGVGLGKTHLMHAIGHHILRENPDANLLYLTSEEFTNQVIAAIAKKTNEELRNRLRNVDVLLVDDIQFIAGKVATQEEFFHTFNQLHQMGKQIVISSDRPPREIPTLEERLQSRFEWGLVSDIQKPDYETRMAILNRKAEEEHFHVDDEVIGFIAESVKSNIRELEGALNRVIAIASLNHVPVTLDLTREALQTLFPIRDPRRITAELIMQVVATYSGITVADLTSSRRSRELSVPRQMAMYLCREMTDLSTPRIGAAFGNRDHTTVMHACEKVAKEVASSAAARNSVETLKAKILDS